PTTLATDLHVLATRSRGAAAAEHRPRGSGPRIGTSRNSACSRRPIGHRDGRQRARNPRTPTRRKTPHGGDRVFEGECCGGGGAVWVSRVRNLLTQVSIP